MTLQALWVAACPDEAGKFFHFLATAAASRLSTGAELQIMYGVGGERDLSERELAHLPGWRDSSPVRVGNGAWKQRQLDVYGELLDAAATLPDYLTDMEPGTQQSSWPTQPTPPPRAGSPGTMASGKFVAHPGTTCIQS